MCLHAPGFNQNNSILPCTDLSNYIKITTEEDVEHQCSYTLHFHSFPCNLNSTLKKNGPESVSKSPSFVSTVLRDQATGSAMHNAPV